MIWTPYKVELAKGLRAKRLTYAEIAEQVGCTSGGVKCKLAKLGINRVTHATSWTRDRIAEMQLLLSQGLTTTEVGKLLGCSKNAITGKVSRIRAARMYVLPSLSPLMRLGPHDCRWPIGDPKAPDFRFCAEPAILDRPYCAGHAAKAYHYAKP